MLEGNPKASSCHVYVNKSRKTSELLNTQISGIEIDINILRLASLVSLPLFARLNECWVSYMLPSGSLDTNVV
jgi:hypothetical protein